MFCVKIWKERRSGSPKGISVRFAVRVPSRVRDRKFPIVPIGEFLPRTLVGAAAAAADAQLPARPSIAPKRAERRILYFVPIDSLSRGGERAQTMTALCDEQ